MKATFANTLLYSYELLEALSELEQGLVSYGKNKAKQSQPFHGNFLI